MTTASTTTRDTPALPGTRAEPPTRAEVRAEARADVQAEVQAEVRAAVAAIAGAHLADVVATGTPNARWIAAGSPWLTPAAAATLAGDFEPIRRVVAENPAAPPHVLARLARDDDARISQAATTNRACPYEAVLAYGRPRARLTHPDAPPDRLVTALEDPGLRGAVLAHPSTPWEPVTAIRDSLTLDEHVHLLRNPNMTQPAADESLAVLDLLGARRHSARGTDAWARHPDAAPDWLAATAHRRLTTTAAADYDGWTSRILHAVAAHPATPTAVLALIADTGSDTALGNPSCPVDAMHRALDRRAPAGNDDNGGTGGVYGVAGMASADRSRRTFDFHALGANPAAPTTVLGRLTVADLPGLLADVNHTSRTLYDAVAAHTHTPAHAHVTLTIAATWTDSLAELLQTAAAIGQPARDCATGR